MTVRSEIAPNILNLTEGVVVIGDIFAIDESYGQLNHSVDRIFHDPFFDEDFVEFTRAINHTPPYDPSFQVKYEVVKSLVVNDNRTMYLNLVSHHLETVDYNITVFVDYQDDLNVTQDDLKVTYNGVTYVYSTMDEEEPINSTVTFWVMNWALANIFDKQMQPYLKYAISPQSTIGQEILYGQYNGTVVGFTEYYISPTEYFEAIEVHHDETIVTIDLFGSDQYYTLGDTTLLYEKETGIILHWLEYNSSAGYYYYYNATDVVGISPIIVVPEFSIPFIAIISCILIATPVLIYRRKKK